MKTFRLALSVASIGLAINAAGAASLLPPEPVRLDDLSAFKAPGANWTLASGIGGDPRREAALSALPGIGAIANTAAKATGSNLFTSWEHGDIELELEFLVPVGSNSGVYLQSRYEVQLFDSWGVENPTFADCGAIYQRYNEKSKKGYEGAAPEVNAARAPGLWQTLRIVFQAPRFDASGKKTENARFIEVALNGFVIHENVEVTGPTRAAAFGDEKALAPLMIQGDHGPVALRNIAIKRYTTNAVTVSGLASEIREGENLDIAKLDATAPTSAPKVSDLDIAALGVTNNFAASYQGRIHIPTTGDYAFHAESLGPTGLTIAGRTALAPLSPGGRTIPLRLEAGVHDFRLDYTHGRWRAAALKLSVEGPGIRMHDLTPETKAKKKGKKSELIIEPTDDRVRVQRGFIPYHPLKRLYAIGVGSPNHVHYAYDFDTASILHAWNGPFLDTFEMWDGRGHNQIAKPAGPALTLPALPTVALVESTEHDWPNVPDALWTNQGYALDANGQPEFHATLAELSVSDRIVSTSPTRGLERTLKISGDHTSWWTGVLLAQASTITAAGDGRYIVGDREYYLDVSPDNKTVPFVRRINGHDQLLLWLPKSKAAATVTYTLVW